ncbi:MAG: hypothetical protein ABI658_15630, partial [Acidimicrobiales bacterium]
APIPRSAFVAWPVLTKLACVTEPPCEILVFEIGGSILVLGVVVNGREQEAPTSAAVRPTSPAATRAIASRSEYLGEAWRY